MSGGRPQLREGEHGRVTFGKLADGRTRARVYARVAGHAKLKQVVATGATRDEAETALRAKLKKLPDIYAGSSFTGASTVAEVIDDYLKRLPSMALAIQTRSRYAASADGTLRRLFGHVRLHALTADDVDRAFLTLNTEHHSEAKNARVVLRAVLQIAVRAKAIAENPAAGGSRLANPRRKKVLALDGKGVASLFALIDADRHKMTHGPKSRKAHDDLRDLLDVQLGAGGLRISEAAALRISDVDFNAEPPTARSHSAVVYQPPTDGAHGYYLVQEVTKTHQIRVVSLDEEAAEVVRRRAVTASADGLLFHIEGRPLNLNNVRRTLRRALEGTSFEGWLSTHTMRRSVGTAVAREHGLGVATALLGHSGEGVTEKSYIERVEIAPDMTHVTQSLRG